MENMGLGYGTTGTMKGCITMMVVRRMRLGDCYNEVNMGTKILKTRNNRNIKTKGTRMAKEKMVFKIVTKNRSTWYKKDGEV